MGKLNYVKVKNLTRPGLHGDGGTLFLKVQVRNGRVSKAFVQRLTVKGQRRDIGLGAWPLVSLAEAREVAFDNRRIARRGGDPKPRKLPTFREAAIRTHKALSPRWRNVKATAQWLRTLDNHACPKLGDMPIDSIGRADVLDVLGPIWSTKHGVAVKLRSNMKQVFQWARAKGFIDDNPAGEAIDGALPRLASKGRNYRALPFSEVPAAMDTVGAYPASVAASACLRFVILTACRSGEARGATWDEFDMSEKLWRIPASRMKANREHRIPLSPAALAVLAEVEPLKGRAGLVFPSPVKPHKPLSDATLTRIMQRTGLAKRGTVHGMRASFRQWAMERTNADHAVMELSIAHAVGKATERAYARSDLLDKRRALMERWAAFLTDQNASVVQLHG